MVDDSVLRSGLEFAVKAAAARKVVLPDGLRGSIRLDAAGLRRVRRAVEGDPEVRRQLGELASADHVDEAGMLWLQQPDGWEQRLAELAPDDRAHRRLRRVEDKLRRTEQRVGELEADNERLRRQASSSAAEAADLQAEVARLGAALTEAAAIARRKEHEAAQAAQRAAQARAAQRAAEELAAATQRTRATDLPVALADAAALVEQLDDVLRRATVAAALSPSPPRARPAANRRRTPLALPGGVRDRTEEAADHVLRAAGAVVLVDGYNVAKLGWPDQPLADQRERLIEVSEAFAMRIRADVTIVFDGADVRGANAPRRKAVTVEYSPAGVSADDVLRQRVQALPEATPVVVVTDDRAVRDDVHRAGANLVASDTYLHLARR